MLPVYTAEEMRACDKAATDIFGIPSIVLMENAARGSADFMEKALGSLEGRSALILCGKGNNGGDGYALARHLLNRGMKTSILAVAAENDLSGDARLNAETAGRMNTETGMPEIRIMSGIETLKTELSRRPDVVVDALLGTGLVSDLRGLIADAVVELNASGAIVFSLDMPSGINADNGAEMGASIQARRTATMGGLKRGLLLGEGRMRAGKVEIIDIGMPLHGRAHDTARTFLIERQDVRDRLPDRPFNAHKYSMGHVFALAGSVGYTGAAAMTAEAVYRSGAGIVTLGIPESVHSILASKLTEVITIPLHQTATGTLSMKGADKALDLINKADSALLGPGLNRDDETLEAARMIIENAEVPLVVDADALYALADHCELLKKAAAPRILTPHCGELSRLTGLAAKEIDADRIDVSRDFALRHRVTLLLKGAPSVTASADGEVFINSTGNPGMATAGAGDILTGIIAGLLVQRMSPREAAFCGAWLHGGAGDAAALETGMRSLTAGYILNALPRVLRSLESTVRER